MFIPPRPPRPATVPPTTPGKFCNSFKPQSSNSCLPKHDLHAPKVLNRLNQVLGQIKSIGHPVPEIMQPNLCEFTHLGDSASKSGRLTDNKSDL